MVAVPSRDPARLFAKLMDQDIVTSFRDSNIRATIHFYNSEDDIDTLRCGPQGAPCGVSPFAVSHPPQLPLVPAA